MSVSIDGIKLEDIGVKVLAGSNVPIAPPTRDRLVVVPGRAGAYDFGSEFDVRTFELECAIMRQASAVDLQRKAREIAALFTDAYGRPKNVRLVFDDEPDKYYTVKLTGAVPIERIARLGLFTVVLRAADPMAKSVVTSDQIVMDSDTPILADLAWDTGLSERQVTAPTTFTVINNGSVAIRFAYKIVGTGTAVTLAANGKTFGLGTFSGQTIEVDGENYAVKFGGVNDLTKTSGDFIELMPGANDVTVTGSGMNFTISESLTYKYV